MQFRNDHKVIIETLNRDEGQAFLDFLRMEQQRHIDEREKARQMYAVCVQKNDPTNTALAKFWFSAVLRHTDDIHDTVDLIGEVKQRRLGL